jgi:hypothetical protein
MIIGYVGKTEDFKRNSATLIYQDSFDEYQWPWFDWPPRKVVILDLEEYERLTNSVIGNNNG